MDREQMIDALEQELYLKTAGYTTAIGVYQNANGGYSAVDIVVLDSDGMTIAYRLSTETQDGEWMVGSIEDAVDCALEEYDRLREIGVV
ncbi:hypothetical protein D6833_00320 [Candidatus Parcubacteria bacterium]|nr:MAG: hypothetical protein D6833_00320 [Candidatus Parcubacteria bacterium]